MLATAPDVAVTALQSTPILITALTSASTVAGEMMVDTGVGAFSLQQATPLQPTSGNFLLQETEPN